jgi:hypothetical protein
MTSQGTCAFLILILLCALSCRTGTRLPGINSQSQEMEYIKTLSQSSRPSLFARSQSDEQAHGSHNSSMSDKDIPQQVKQAYHEAFFNPIPSTLPFFCDPRYYDASIFLTARACQPYLNIPLELPDVERHPDYFPNIFSDDTGACAPNGNDDDFQGCHFIDDDLHYQEQNHARYLDYRDDDDNDEN